ncbi:DUF2851 family protein [Tichowtungia aerotolerans]|uniref:DUF2851 family protein n=1 Tax=Tichowtungia aerotolerans TaxID=2697043 RepID=A0A6P1M8W4_9BACT|nr:DUF2851 family protein [Tichowtungia aerotolerans]QHI69513.1 DUF2851 family protein [Tichowtungia aerotolerans]
MFYRSSEVKEELFPGAAGYRRICRSNELREGPGYYFPYSERHVQALWFDDSLRPSALKTSLGEPVAVESPGRWNLEAGPDFRGAVLLVGRERRRVAGDAEIHIFSSDWKNHGHHTDSRYDDVRFHITWFAGPVNPSQFPPGTVHISLSDQCAINLDSIDVTAYPYGEPRASSHFPMSGKRPDEISQTLENAGMERMRQKALRLAWLMQERGEAQAVYEETAAALGYKNNKVSFRKLAQTMPLSALARYGDDWETVYAVLLGISGLLPKQPGAKWSTESKAYFRSLWDCWWHEEHCWEDVIRMNRSDWNFSGVRPLNHPVRRLCVLAQWVSGGFFQCLEEKSVCSETAFQALEKSFWNQRIGWTGKEKKTELIGKGRLQAIELNVFVPYRLAKGEGSALGKLPAESMNSVIKEAAYILFGPDHSSRLYRSAMARQGLLQIHSDFILPGRISELG